MVKEYKGKATDKTQEEGIKNVVTFLEKKEDTIEALAEAKGATDRHIEDMNETISKEKHKKELKKIEKEIKDIKNSD